MFSKAVQRLFSTFANASKLFERKVRVKSIRRLSISFIFFGAFFLGSCSGNTYLAEGSDAQSSYSVIPLPEADNKYDTSTPVDTIVVDKYGTMTETQYPYDPDKQGVVINNYEDVAGPNASVFFPAFEVGLLWWGGYWTDHDGYYWDGDHYAYINDPHWHDHWDHYWNRDWNNKWNQYRQDHPNAGHQYGRNGGNFQHHHGMNRPDHPPRGGGHHGGGRR